MNYILAIDQGTTGTTALLMDCGLNAVADASVDFEQYFPRPGWVEHDLEDIWTAVCQTVREVTRYIDPRKIAAIGITNQRETLCFWDHRTGAPLARAIVWQDRRTAGICDQLLARGLEPFFQERTGLLIDPYFSGTKAAWALENWGDLKTAHRAGRLRAGTIDSYLISRISGSAEHVTEPSNASRTLCFNLVRHEWDPDLCEALGVPMDIWPEVRPSVGTFALTRGFGDLPDGIPVTGALGDQQSALMGQACFKEGQAKCTYGTGAFLLLNTGRKPARSKHRLVSTVAWALAEDNYTYAIEGSAFIAGAAVQWLRDGLGLIQDAGEVESLAASVPTSDGVVFVPALTGLGAPHWVPDATGLFTGITRGTTRAHLARAVLEGIAFQNADILEAMTKDMGKPIEGLNVDGGASANDLLMQMQADILGTRLRRPACLESTSMGAVYAAGLGAGIWADLTEIERSRGEYRDFTPSMNGTEREAALARWRLAIARATYRG